MQVNPLKDIIGNKYIAPYIMPQRNIYVVIASCKKIRFFVFNSISSESLTQNKYTASYIYGFAYLNY